MASASLRSHLRAIELATTEKRLDGPSRQILEQAVAALPEDGFDWSECVRIELVGLRTQWARAEAADDPLTMVSRDFEVKDEKALARILGLTSDQLKKRAAIRAALRRSGGMVDAMRPKLVSAFHLPLDRSTTALRELEAAARQDPMLARALPSFVRADQDGRGGVLKARADLLALLRTR